jgi:hypothetical protein
MYVLFMFLTPIHLCIIPLFSLSLSNVGLRVATAVHARRTRPREKDDAVDHNVLARRNGRCANAPSGLVNAATRTDFFSRAQVLSSDDAIGRIFHRVWRAVVREVGTDIDDKATCFFRPTNASSFSALIARIRGSCEEATDRENIASSTSSRVSGPTAVHSIVATIIPLFDVTVFSKQRDSAGIVTGNRVDVDNALVWEMLDEVLDTIEGYVRHTYFVVIS